MIPYLNNDLIKQNENFNDGYYHFIKDVIDYPDAWCYVIWSKRGPGKTYSNLWASYYLGIKNAYIKRTNDDLDFICRSEENSPYAPLNRDKNINVVLQKIDKSRAFMYNGEPNDDGIITPSGAPISMALSLNGAKTIKGFEGSEYEWITLDEFIPQAGEIVKRREGEMILDLYMTLQRDRLKRGKCPQKLILFANAEEISTPITRTLNIIDEMALLQFTGKTHLYLKDRDILLHHITNDEIPLTDNEKVGIYKGMAGTSWAKKTFEGEFTANDFSRIKNENLKNYKCIARLIYTGKDIYIYQKREHYYLCYTKQPYHADTYNLNEEAEAKRFYYDFYIDLQNALIDNTCFFSHYSIYDLITRFKKYFTI